MSVQTAIIYLKNSSSGQNYKLFAYIKEHITHINASGLFLKFEIANANDNEYFKERGIYGFPALEINGQTYIGNPDIEGILNKIMTQPRDAKTEEDDVQDFLFKTVTTNSNGSRFVPPQMARAAPTDSNKSLLEQQQIYIDNDEDDEDEDAAAIKLRNQFQQALMNRKKYDPKFGKGMEKPQNNNKNTPEGLYNSPKNIQQPILQSKKVVTRRPSNANRTRISKVPPQQKQQVIAQPKNPDDELLNKLYENQI